MFEALCGVDDNNTKTCGYTLFGRSAGSEMSRCGLDVSSSRLGSSSEETLLVHSILLKSKAGCTFWAGSTQAVLDEWCVWVWLLAWLVGCVRVGAASATPAVQQSPEDEKGMLFEASRPHRLFSEPMPLPRGFMQDFHVTFYCKTQDYLSQQV